MGVYSKIFMWLGFCSCFSLFIYLLFLRGRSRGKLGQNIKTGLDFNGLLLDLIHDNWTLWCCLVHIADSTNWKRDLVVVTVFYKIIIDLWYALDWKMLNRTVYILSMCIFWNN